LQQVYGARKVRCCHTIIDAPPFVESAGREDREPREEVEKWTGESPPPRDSEETMTTVFWGDDEGPVVMVWDGMTQEEQVIAQRERETGFERENRPNFGPGFYFVGFYFSRAHCRLFTLLVYC
jgi:hypothetical protein